MPITIPKEGISVRHLAESLGLWEQISAGVSSRCCGDRATVLLPQIAAIRVLGSRATSRLGSYTFRGKDPVCIRLQLAQEPESLCRTFLHELAHACDHLYRGWRPRRRFGHGEQWRRWAQILGAAPRSAGSSKAVTALHQQRQKLVAVCQGCGAEIRRARRLNQKGRYIHPPCGGTLK
ncbi:MAG: SprT-like domain-containing protein, partial [Pelovirga sp.]